MKRDWVPCKMLPIFEGSNCPVGTASEPLGGFKYSHSSRVFSKSRVCSSEPYDCRFHCEKQ